MSELALGLAVCLAVHATVASAASLAVVAAASRPLARRLAAQAPVRRARTLFGLALLPAGLGIAATLGVALPAWILHEPRGGAEPAGPVLLALAALGIVLLVGRPAAAALEAWRTARLVRRWRAEGREMPGLPLPATRVELPGPLAALAGLLRPRLLLSRTLVEALEPGELEAVVEHERAHAAARENLRQWLLRASPDPLALFPAGRRLRTEYEQAAERAADEAACARVPPLRLARALLKTASLAQGAPPLAVAAASLHREGAVADRVRALVVAHERGPDPVPGAGSRRGQILLAAAALAALAAAPGVPGLARVHAALEALVHLLS